MIRKRTCVGFSYDAERQYRKVEDDDLIMKIHDECSALCARCTGHRGDSVEQIFVESWQLSWRCRKSGEFSGGCEDRCRIVIVDIARKA